MPDDPNSAAGSLPASPGSGVVRNLDPFPAVVEALENVPPRRDNSKVVAVDDKSAAKIIDEKAAITGIEEQDLREALQAAAVAVAEIPAQYNRDQATAAVSTFLRKVAAIPDVTTEQMRALAAQVDEVRDPPEWRPDPTDEK